MLGAGVVAAGQVDVDRPVELDARLAPARDLLGVALGVGGGEPAADVAGAGDQPGADRVALVARPSASIAASASVELVVRHAGDQQVLPDRQPDIAVAQVAPRSSASPRICAAVSLPTGSTTPIQFKPCLLLRDGRRCGPRGRRAAAARSLRPERGSSFAAELLLDQRQILLEAHGVEHVFQPRLVAVGAVAVLDEHADDGVGDLGRILGLHQHAGVAREILVPGDAAQRQAEPDAGLDAEAVLHLDRREADVVGVLQHRDDARRRRRRR